MMVIGYIGVFLSGSERDMARKINITTIKILDALEPGEALYQSQLMYIASSRTNIILKKLIEKGLVTSEVVPAPPGEKGPPRTYYTITSNGKKLLSYYNRIAKTLS